MTSIVILTFNQLAYTSECVASIERHTPQPHEIIFVDNGSTDGTVVWLQDLVAANPGYRLIANNENKGFAAGCNQGLMAARGDFLLLLNNDVVVTPGWLGGLLECLNESEDVGVVGPMTNAASGPQLVAAVDYRVMDGLDRFARQFRSRYRHRRIPGRRVVGFCMLFRRALMERIGRLDEQFGSGNFEDDDFCYRAALAGFRNTVAADVYVHHFGSVSFQGNNIDYEAALHRNRRLYARKWQGGRHEERLSRQILAVQTLEKAAERFQSWDLDGAITVLLDEGIRFLPEDGRLYHALAEYLLDAGQFKDALDTIQSMPQEALSVRSDLLAGSACLGLGDHGGASLRAESVLVQKPGCGEALNLLGEVALAREESGTARRLFTEAIASCTPPGAAFTNLALLELPAGRTKAALTLLEKGVQLSPLSSFVRNTYHRLISQQETPERGISVFREALHFFPGSRSIRYLLIDLLIRAGQIQEALSGIQELLVRFGVVRDMLEPALDLRNQIGPQAPSSHHPTGRETVALCMIVKDEESVLPRCLASLVPLVDEMVVVDTGSSDASREIARIFGARVYDFEWQGDFSAARNFAIDQAGTDWILAMDADEVLAQRDHAALLQLLSEHHDSPRAYAMVTRNYTRQVDQEQWQVNSGEYPAQEAGVGWVPSSKVRLFPCLPEVRFANPIHELVEPSLAALEITVTDIPVPVHHYGGLNRERLQRKAEAYYRIGCEKLAVDPDNIKALFELAVQAGETGRHHEALELWQRVLALNPDLPPAHFNMGFNYLKLGQFLDARSASTRALELQTDYPEALANQAYSELCVGSVATAQSILEKALAGGASTPLLHLLLASTCCCKGEMEKALREFDRLREQQIEFAAFINELSEGLLLCQKNDEAARLLRSIVEWGYGDSGTERLLNRLINEKPL